MRKLTGATLVALFVLLTIGAVPAVAAFDHSANEATILRLVNHARVRRGLHAVTIVRTLDRAALRHSRDMVADDYFAHSAFSRGSAHWSIGEVIAWGKASRGTPASIFRAWMHSSAHRRVILTRRWRSVGIGCARGTFQGLSGVVMYTVDLGRRVQ
jgi:uncharacterized protein YkwD